MDKIQELHGKLFMQEQTVGEYMKDHASITEDLMGKILEWAGRIGFELNEGYWSSKNIKGIQVYTTSKLIQLFKETL